MNIAINAESLSMQDAMLLKERITPQISAGGSFDMFNFPSTLMPAGQRIASTGFPAIFEGNTSVNISVNLRHGNIITVSTVPDDPIIEGTNIPVYRVSALLDGGMTIAQVLEDFPSLTEDQILFVRDYVRHYPNVGKQYPKKSLKRLLRQSGIYELDQELKSK